MRSLLAVMLSVNVVAAVACGGSKVKHEGAVVNEGSGSAVGDNCCCKSFPISSNDGLPVYENDVNRIECSSKQGTCVDEVQCTQQPVEGGAVPTE